MQAMVTNYQGLIRDYYISIDVADDWSGMAWVQILEHRGVALDPPACVGTLAANLLAGNLINGRTPIGADPIAPPEWDAAVELAKAAHYPRLVVGRR